MANVTISQLPAAGPITGDELVPVVQNGVTVHTTAQALAASPTLTQTFLTLNQEPTLNNSRRLTGGTGIGLVDGGAQSTLQIALNGASGSLEGVGLGLVAKRLETPSRPGKLPSLAPVWPSRTAPGCPATPL